MATTCVHCLGAGCDACDFGGESNAHKWNAVKPGRAERIRCRSEGALSMKDILARTRLSRSWVYLEIQRGALKTFNAGGRAWALPEDFERWMQDRNQASTARQRKVEDRERAQLAALKAKYET